MKQPVPFKALAPINTLIHALQCKADQFRYGILLLMSFLLLISGNISAQNTCPGISAPVCGSNGVTYLNSCYAEAAGITEYTTGVSYHKTLTMMPIAVQNLIRYAVVTESLISINV